jgi:hypothetical protein
VELSTGQILGGKKLKDVGCFKNWNACWNVVVFTRTLILEFASLIQTINPSSL